MSEVEFCKKHQTDYYGWGYCPACTELVHKRMKRIKKAMRSIHKWINVKKLSKDHPINEMRRAVGR